MNVVFTAPSHHDVLVLVIQVAVLLLAARSLGELAQRLGQPSVVGELLAGIALGPSLLSSLFPELGLWILPQTEVQGYLLETVALLGAIFLLVITGLETDLALIRRHARTALSVSFGGILVTFSTGFLLGWWLPDFLLADPERRLVFALFVATAMAISAIPVIAKVLMDLDLMRRDIGQTILAAGMSDDTIGWILLGIVAGLARTGEVSATGLAQTVGSVIVFLVLSFTVGRWLFRRSLAYVQDEVRSHDRLLTLVVVLTFVWGGITQALGLEPVLGAFVAGILFGQIRRLPESVHQRLESLALGIFAPIFFAVAGLKVNVAALLDPTLGALALVVILVASLGKVTGTYLGARLGGGKDHWTALSYGAGLNARGALEIIIATIGLQLGILGQEMFSIIVIMAMATSLMAPTALRAVLARVTPGEEELRRLRREELSEGTLVGQLHRVLMPLRVRPDSGLALQTVEARFLERLGSERELSITLLSVAAGPAEEEAWSFLERVGALFSHLEVVPKVVVEGDAVRAILEEAVKDYDLILLGAPSPTEGAEVVFSGTVDEVGRMAPCATAVVRGAVGGRTATEWAPRRLLVPTNGSVASRRAAELAFALADSDVRAGVTVLNVVTPEARPHHVDARGADLERRLGIAHRMVEELRSMGESLDVRTEADVRVGPDPETVIVDVAGRLSKDLILVGTNVRPGSDRLFLGPRVERILARAPCPVVVLNAD